MGRNKQELLQLAMPASWWLTLAVLADDMEESMDVCGIYPEPWEVLYKVSKAIKKQFPPGAAVK